MVIVSNGFQKFHLSVAAAEAYKRGSLSAFITGAYPTATVRGLMSLPGLRTNAKVKRLVAREDEIPEQLVRALSASEFLNILGGAWHSEKTAFESFKIYGAMATRHVTRAGANGARLYHYRAGFGGKSVQAARKLGMIALCDHSIAHPRVIAYMVNNHGQLPARPIDLKLGLLDRYILDDIEQADAVLVNSDFVKDTFNYVGHTHSSVHVVYWGVDEYFLEQIPSRQSHQGTPRLLTVGFQKRKGAEVLAAALRDLKDLPWDLSIGGGLETDMAERCADLLGDSRVHALGQLSRRDLAEAFSRAEIFVFPSLVEGSARVIFEAMACGCYIITTPNSGSIVQDGVHGRLVPTGDAAALSWAIKEAIAAPERVAEIGARNANVVRTNYRQTHYGDKLAVLYREMVASKAV